MSTTKPSILALTGYAGAGKDSFAALLVPAFAAHGKEAIIVASGDLIRQYVRDHQLGDPGDRSLLGRVASKVMAERGYTVWLEEAIAGASKSTDILLYPGLRHPDEVTFLHDRSDVVMGIDVPVERRYEWAVKRGRPGDNIPFETFKANEEAERAGQGQQLEAVMALIDSKLENDGTLEQFEQMATVVAADYPAIKSRYNAKEL